LIVTMPLLYSSYYAVTSLDRLAVNSAKTVFDVVQLTRTEQLLRDQLKSTERMIRQYKLFRDEKIREILNRRIEDLRNLIDSLHEVGSVELRKQIVSLEKDIQVIETIFAADQVTDEDVDLSIDKFENIFTLANSVSAGVRAGVDMTASSLKERSKSSKYSLIIGSLIVISLTMFLIFFFFTLIGRSFRQLEQAITRLGDYNLQERIRVSGPRDVRELGSKLNWLRLRLDELENQKQKFLRHMSHELKTPVANFQEGSSLLADEIPGPLNDKQKEVVEILQTNVHAFKHHIENLLDYNLLKFSSGSNIDHFELESVIDEAIAAHKLSADNKKLRVMKLGRKTELAADRQKFKTVIENLISNAVSFTPNSGIVTVCWKNQKDAIELSVTDNGPGLDPEERERIFAPFYQGQAKRSGPLKGSGIGLSVARECIHSLGGKIFAKNNKNQGASFVFQVPVVLMK